MKIDGKTTKQWREWLSAKEAAEYTGLGFSTLAKLRLKGGGPVYTKIGMKILYSRASLDAWLESKSVANTSQYASFTACLAASRMP